MGRGNDDRTYLIDALWDPNSPQFEVLNTETPKGSRSYFFDFDLQEHKFRFKILEFI